MDRNLFNTYFDKIFVINLDHRKDRWEKVQEQFEKMGITNYERFSAIKPNFQHIPQDWYARLVSPQKWTIIGQQEDGKYVAKWNQNYVCGALGCKMSHYQIIRLAKERGYKNFLVFEDDVVFKKSKNETLRVLKEATSSLPEDYHMFYLSGNHMKEPTEITENLFKVNGTLTTHAYAMSNSCYDFALQSMMDAGCEIDNYYWGKIQSQGKCYTIKPTIIKQAPGFSDVMHQNLSYDNIIT